MEKIWTGRFKKTLDSAANSFNASIGVDGRMYREDITGSVAHAKMLAACGIITDADAKAIVAGLEGILADIDAGKLDISPDAEDIHSFVEAELTARIGDAGKKLHTARSRNDQVALDLRLFLRGSIDDISAEIRELISALLDIAEEYSDAVVPGYTHMQRGQPIVFGHQLCAYAQMLLRDISRLSDCRRRMNVSPLGSCALAGTTYPTDRFMTARLLDFDAPCLNSIDGVSDRDFAVELAADIAIISAHLSRLAEETILWCSREFGFAELDDSYSTGSSIMPQKKNPDMAELVRGKTGRVYGNLTTLLTMLKGLPLAYNKDMQEDKEAIFDSIDTVSACITLFAAMLRTAKFNRANMRKAAAEGFINATDCADYLTKKGMPFREAYKLTGELVAFCIENKLTLESLTLEQYKSFTELFEADIFNAIDLDVCVSKRISYGGTAPESVKSQVAEMRRQLA